MNNAIFIYGSLNMHITDYDDKNKEKLFQNLEKASDINNFELIKYDELTKILTNNQNYGFKENLELTKNPTCKWMYEKNFILSNKFTNCWCERMLYKINTSEIKILKTNSAEYIDKGYHKPTSSLFQIN